MLPQREADFRKAMEDRGMEIYLEETDPYRGGFEPKHWKHADDILEENDELLISGGNRSGKTEFCAKWVVKLAKEKQVLGLPVFTQLTNQVYRTNSLLFTSIFLLSLSVRSRVRLKM